MGRLFVCLEKFKKKKVNRPPDSSTLNVRRLLLDCLLQLCKMPPPARAWAFSLFKKGQKLVCVYKTREKLVGYS